MASLALLMVELSDLIDGFDQWLPVASKIRTALGSGDNAEVATAVNAAIKDTTVNRVLRDKLRQWAAMAQDAWEHEKQRVTQAA